MIGPIVAIGKNTFQEAIRSKVFVICLVVLAILCAFAPMFPSINSPHAKLKLALSVSLQLCFYFGLIIIIFTAAAFLPEEINSKRIYTIFPKPVSRFQYLVGKLLGICFLAFSLLFVFAITVILFVRITYHSLPDAGKKEGLSFFNTIDSFPADSFKKFRRNKEVGDVPAHTFEITYKNISIADYDAKISLKILASYIKAGHPNEVYFDMDILDVENQSSLMSLKEMGVLDKKLITIPLPNEMSLKNSKNIVIKLSIHEKSRDYLSGVYIKSTDFHFHKKAKPLELNVLRAFSLFAIQFILLGFVAVVASTRMSFYVSALFAFTTFAAGSFTGFLKTYLTEKQDQIDMKIIDPNAFFSKVGHLADQYMQLICNLMPNFSKYDVSSEVIDGLTISNGRFLEIATHYSIFIVIYLVMGTLMIWRREV